MLPQYNAGSESSRRGGSVRTPNDGRYHLARETGGVYFQSYDSPHIATNRILQDLQGYYLLAYTPDASGPQSINRRIDKISWSPSRKEAYESALARLLLGNKSPFSFHI